MVATVMVVVASNGPKWPAVEDLVRCSCYSTSGCSLAACAECAAPPDRDDDVGDRSSSAADADAKSADAAVAWTCPAHACAACGLPLAGGEVAWRCIRCPKAYHRACRPASVHVLEVRRGAARIARGGGGHA